MIAVENLIYGIDLRLNKGSSLINQQIPIENKLIALNRAQIKLILQKLSPNNTLGMGFEALKKRYEDLQLQIESSHDHPLELIEVDKKLNKWNAPISSLIPKYMFYIESYVIAHKQNCTNRIIYVNNDLTKHSDVITLLNNTSYKPSFEYQETFCTITNNFIEIYTDGSFTPEKIYVSYIKYPKEIDFPGWEKLDGSQSVRQDCELAPYLEDELLNITIQELAAITENVGALQTNQERIKTQE